MDIIIIDTVYKNLEMPVEKVSDKRYGEIIKYKCDFCRTEYSNQRELQEHVKLEHNT
jgi:hypothetical protein